MVSTTEQRGVKGSGEIVMFKMSLNCATLAMSHSVTGKMTYSLACLSSHDWDMVQGLGMGG